MLRVLTMTDAEKDEARATDPKAAEIIDRCDAMSPEDLMRLHGTFRDPDPKPPTGMMPRSIRRSSMITTPRPTKS